LHCYGLPRQSFYTEILLLINDFYKTNIVINDFYKTNLRVHVRRTDKVESEAAFRSIEEYMKHVIAWYDKLDLRLSKEKTTKKAVRRVYLASDDSSVLRDAETKYVNR